MCRGMGPLPPDSVKCASRTLRSARLLFFPHGQNNGAVLVMEAGPVSGTGPGPAERSRARMTDWMSSSSWEEGNLSRDTKLLLQVLRFRLNSAAAPPPSSRMFPSSFWICAPPLVSTCGVSDPDSLTRAALCLFHPPSPIIHPQCYECRINSSCSFNGGL